MSPRRRVQINFRELVTAESASRAMKVITAERLLLYARAGHAPHVQVDGEIYFRMRAIREWVAANLAEDFKGQPLPRVLPVRVPMDEAALFPPPALASLGPLLRQASSLPAPPAVYFLVRGELVVYVGQSIAMVGRLRQHVTAKDFERVFYVVVPEAELLRVEAAFIRILRPLYNGTASTAATASPEEDEEVIGRAGFAPAELIRQAMEAQRAGATEPIARRTLIRTVIHGTDHAVLSCSNCRWTKKELRDLTGRTPARKRAAEAGFKRHNCAIHRRGTTTEAETEEAPSDELRNLHVLQDAQAGKSNNV